MAELVECTSRTPLWEVARVFLGSHSEKIVQHSPVPVVVVPRGVAEELADEAQSAATAARRRLRR